jgi:DNA polymerase III delta prime subunit
MPQKEEMKGGNEGFLCDAQLNGNVTVHHVFGSCAEEKMSRATHSCSLNLLTSRIEVEYNDDGLTALIFTSEGDMRQAINNLQSTWSGFGLVSGDNVFKVCDQPHPIAVQSMIRAYSKGDIEHSMGKLQEIWYQGYSAVDIIVTIFRVVKTFDEWVFDLLLAF